MAPLKFEENIKETLSERSITPSEDSWNRLASKLDEGKNKKRTPIWWAIAAGFVGLVIIGSLLFKGEGNEKQQEFVEIDTQNEFVQPETELESPKTEIATQQPETKVIVERENLEKQQKPLEKKPEIVIARVKNTPTVIQESQEIIIPKSEVSISEVATTDITNDKSAFETKVDQVVSDILDLQAQNSEVSEAEVVALLDAAQDDLKNKPLINPLTQKVDAMALLDQVEFDLEQSFRDKVFDALGDGYSKIRTAMADRNN